MSISLNPVLQGRKYEMANAVAILSLLSATPLAEEMTPAQQSAVLKDKLDNLAVLDSIVGLAGTTNEDFRVATQSLLKPEGFGNLMEALNVLLNLTPSDGQMSSTIPNLFKVSATAISGSGIYSTIEQALAVIANQAPSASSRFIVEVYPGTYTENIIIPDYVDIVGANREAVIINGTVERNSVNGGKISNLTIRSTSGATVIVSAAGEYILRNLTIENNAGGTALMVNNNEAIVVVDNTKLESTNGAALMVTAGQANVNRSFLVGRNGAVVNNGSTLIFSGGEIQALNNGLYCDSSSQIITAFGVIKADACCVKTEGGILRLLGGVFISDTCSISADALSTVHLGAVSVSPQTQDLNGAIIVPDASVKGLGFVDSQGLFAHSLAPLKTLEGIIIELGQARVQHQKEIEALHDKSNHNEHDAIVDAATLQISLMDNAYTLFMVDSFMDPNTNVYPVGDDRAVVLAEKSILTSQSNDEPYSYYRQDFAGNLVDKSKIYLKAAMQKAIADAMGSHDWQIDFYLEVSNGRYASDPVSFLLHSSNALNFFDGRVEKEVILSVPSAGTALTPLIAANELVSIKIAIKSDSTTASATPVVRSFVAFM